MNNISEKKIKVKWKFLAQTNNSIKKINSDQFSL